MTHQQKPRFPRPRAWRFAVLAVAVTVATLASGTSVLQAAARPLPSANPDRQPATMGTSLPAGSLRAERVAHGAALLDDGRVLIVGGRDDLSQGYVTAEIFDPPSDTFTTVPTRDEVRRIAAATAVLPDGRVVIAGGHDTGVVHDTVSIYNPRDHSWRMVQMQAARENALIVVLNDGRALIAGGFAVADGGLRSAEIFDPVTNQTVSVGSMARPRIGGTATVLADGRVLVVGGMSSWGEDGELEATVEIFEPGLGRFVSGGTLATARVWHTATLLESGHVLVAGGFTESFLDADSTEIYDPATGRFVRSAPMMLARAVATSTRLPDGRVLIAGGIDLDLRHAEIVTDSAEVFDPASRSFSLAGSMLDSRAGHTATLLQDGTVLFVGGMNDDFDGLSSAERFTLPRLGGAIIGEIPPRGLAIVVYTGGSNDDLLRASQCPPATARFWVLGSGSRFVGYIPAAPAFVNQEWNARFATGIPPNTAMIASCAP